MTLEEAYNQLLANNKKQRLLEAGYYEQKCDYCYGEGFLFLDDTRGGGKVGYACENCRGSGMVWRAPILK